MEECFVCLELSRGGQVEKEGKELKDAGGRNMLWFSVVWGCGRPFGPRNKQEWQLPPHTSPVIWGTLEKEECCWRHL